MFYPITIPPTPGFGWQGGAEFDTLIRAQESGRNRRIPRRYIGLHRYVAPMKNIPLQAAQSIAVVHKAMLGAAHTFLHIDYLDNQAFNEEFGIGDGSTKDFQLKKTYSPGAGASYERDITKPDVDGDIRIQGDAGIPIEILVNGIATAATVNRATGNVHFASAPALGAVLTWSGRHYVCVRFNRDDLPFTVDNVSNKVFITNGSLELIEELNE